MLNFMKPEKRYAGIDKKLKKVSAGSAPAAIASIFGKRMSGGLLINDLGEVIGIITLTRTADSLCS